MTVRIKWLVPGAIIFEKVEGTVLIDEADEFAQQVTTLINQSDRHLVHSMVDLSDLTTLPTNIKQIAQRVTPAFKHPRMGWLVAYGQDNKLIHYIISIVTGIFKVRFRQFVTNEEAIEFLMSQDQTLPPIPVNEMNFEPLEDEQPG